MLEILKKDFLAVKRGKNKILFHPYFVSYSHSSLDNTSSELRRRGLGRPSLGEIIHLMHALYSNSSSIPYANDAKQAFESSLDDVHGPVVSFSGIMKSSVGLLPFEHLEGIEPLTLPVLAEDYFTKKRYTPYPIIRCTSTIKEEERARILEGLAGKESLALLSDRKVFKHGFEVNGLGLPYNGSEIFYASVIVDQGVPHFWFNKFEQVQGLTFGKVTI